MRKELVSFIKNYEGPPIQIMEVCGSHTKAISQYGIRQLLPSTINLISGPGCPICVTPDPYLSDLRKWCEKKQVLVVCFGDVLRLPQMQMINHEKIRLIYSPLECLEIATMNPHKQVILVAIAFETTAPLVAWVIKKAKERHVSNFKVWCGLKRMPPVLERLSDKKAVQGYLYPGHVAVILGSKKFENISKRYKIPGVISGFKVDDLLVALSQLITCFKEGQIKCINAYEEVVRSEGNRLAQNIMDEVFETRESLWRGMGNVSESGYGLKACYKEFQILPNDKETMNQEVKAKGCLCGAVVMGEKTPYDCPLWGACTPIDPKGPCMVTTEGACAVYYQFEKEGKNAKKY